MAWRLASYLGTSILLVACASGDASRPRTRDSGSTPDAAMSDAGAPPSTDAATPVDALVPPADAFVPPADTWIAPGDGGSRGAGRYLDRCTDDGDCATGVCIDDFGASRLCSRSCSSDLECAHEHTCQSALCVPDDTGAPCSIGAPESCATGLCLGSSAGGQCTKYCASAAECPGGYACTRAGGSTRPICVDIERPCAAPSECWTDLCLRGLGCTAACSSAADCPLRYPGSQPYECRVAPGSTTPICVPPEDVIGADPIGAPCRFDSSGLDNFCRSAVCGPGAPFGPVCVQACTAQGGCGAGLGCSLAEDGGAVVTVCTLAGTLDLDAACERSRDCHSGICWDGYCSRLCADGYCPSAMVCTTIAPGAALCTRP